jgi:hypothetical protein
MPIATYLVLGMPLATESRHPWKPMTGGYVLLIAGKKGSVMP